MNQEGLLFPKGITKKQKKKHHKSIIDRDTKGQRFICGKAGETERHHIYGSANRKYSEQYGLTVYLCPECHRVSETAVHRNKEVRKTLQRIGQRAFENKCGSRQEFIKIFGKNYLEDEEMSTKARSEACRHSTGHIGNTAVYVHPTCPNMHIIKGKYVTSGISCKCCRFYEERKESR